MTKPAFVPYTLAQLSHPKMSLKKLAAIGAQDPLNLKFTKSHNKADRVKKILARQTEITVEHTTSDPVPPHTGSDVPPKTQSLPPDKDQTDFERLVGDPTGTPDGRGGARDNAGRPPGTTQEVQAYRNLRQFPHPVVQGALERLFDAWADATGVDEMSLTKQEAVTLALPWSQAMDLMGVSDKMPPWLVVTCSCIWSTTIVVTGKARIARKRKSLESEPTPAPAPTPKPAPTQTPTPAPEPENLHPAKDKAA